MLVTAFRRAADFLYNKKRPPTTTPVDDVIGYLKLNKIAIKHAPHFPVRINTALNINGGMPTLRGGGRPAETGGFESHPKDIHVVRTADSFIANADEVKVHASQSIIYTVFKDIRGRNNFSILISPRLEHYHDDLFVAFGINGTYGEDRVMTVKSITMPSFDKNHTVTGFENVDVTPENLQLGMTYAKICALQLYAGKHLTMRHNYIRAQEIIKNGRPPVMDGQNPPPGLN